MQFSGYGILRSNFMRGIAKIHGVQSRRFIREIAKRSSGRRFRSIRITKGFWRKIESEYNNSIRKHIRRIYKKSAISFGMPKDVASSMALQFASGRSSISSMMIIESSLKRAIALDNKLKTSLQSSQRLTKEELAREVRLVFSPERGINVAVNEATLAATTGAQDAIMLLGLVSDKDEWKTNPGLTASGVCPICMPLNKTKRKFWSKEFPNGSPAHIGCVCEIKFFNKRKALSVARKNRRKK